MSLPGKAWINRQRWERALKHLGPIMKGKRSRILPARSLALKSCLNIYPRSCQGKQGEEEGGSEGCGRAEAPSLPWASSGHFGGGGTPGQAPAPLGIAAGGAGDAGAAAWGSINPDLSLRVEVSWQLRGKINSWGEKKSLQRAPQEPSGACARPKSQACSAT